METSLMFFSVHLLFNIYYISATFPHKLHFSSCILEIECAIIWTLLFFVPFRDIEKGKVFCRAILIIIRLEIEPRNRTSMMEPPEPQTLDFPRFSPKQWCFIFPLSLLFISPISCGILMRFQAKFYMESCPSGRRCSTRNRTSMMEPPEPQTLDFPRFFPKQWCFISPLSLLFISPISCRFLEEISGKILYGELSEWSKVQHSKSNLHDGTPGTANPWFS